MNFDIRDDFLIPIAPGQSVGRGWLKITDHKPVGVTWHWTAIEKLSDTRRVLGGPNATNKGVSSAHYGIGRTYEEGVDRYVSLDNRSWHAGKFQIIRWDGKKCTNDTKGARTCIGVETCNVGFERPGFPAGPDWIVATHTDSKWAMKIQPWTAEQFDMMVFVGKEIVAQWPHIKPEHHHGHHDICPSYKQDVAGFPFAALLRGIYEDNSIPDVWRPLWTATARQRVLSRLGYDLGQWGADGSWGEWSQRALGAFQNDCAAVVTPHWTTFTSWDAYKKLAKLGLSLDEVAVQG